MWRARCKTNSSEVVREAGDRRRGIALRSTWDVGPELRTGRLMRVLPGYGGSRQVAIHAVYPSRRQLAQKVRVFIDHLADLYGPTPPWDAGLEFLARSEPQRHEEEEPQARNPSRS